MNNLEYKLIKLLEKEGELTVEEIYDKLDEDKKNIGDTISTLMEQNKIVFTLNKTYKLR